MDATELADKMLEWGRAKRALDALSAEIEAAVLAIGKTQVVGKVRASYSTGRAEYDYETGALANGAGDQLIALYTNTVTQVNWRAICKAMGVEAPVVSRGAPSVTVKLDK